MPTSTRYHKSRKGEKGNGGNSSLVMLLVLGIGGAGAALVLLLLVGAGIIWWVTRDEGPGPRADGPSTRPADTKPADPNPAPNPEPPPEQKPDRKPITVLDLAPVGWQRYADPAAGFRVFFPEGKVEQRPNKNPQTGVATTEHGLRDAQTGMEYSVVVVDTGSQAPGRGGLAEAFKAEVARGQLLAAEKKIKLGDYFGVEFQLTGAGKSTTARAYEVVGKVFAVAVSVPGQETAESAQNTATCLDSFQITTAFAPVAPDTPLPPNSGVGKPPPGWQVFVTPDAAACLFLPEGQVGISQQKYPSSRATVTSYGTSDPDGRVGYQVVFTEPDNSDLKGNGLLRVFKAWLTNGLPAKSEQRIMMGTIEGIEIQYTKSGWVYTARVYNLSNRLIAIMVRAPEQGTAVQVQNTRICLDSFKIAGAGPNMPGRPPGGMR
jgi:hypothetical protein